MSKHPRYTEFCPNNLPIADMLRTLVIPPIAIKKIIFNSKMIQMLVIKKSFVNEALIFSKLGIQILIPYVTNAFLDLCRDVEKEEEVVLPNGIRYVAILKNTSVCDFCIALSSFIQYRVP